MKNRLTLNYSQVADATPINRNAIAVTRNSGEHFTDGEDRPARNATLLHWENCPPLIPIPSIKHAHGRELARSLMGKKFGRMTVVGLFRERLEHLPIQDQAAIWVVRCTCGCYEGRRYKAINNPENTNDMCHNCRHLEFIKRRYRELGSL
jgi:hypothetical protein